MAYFGVIADDFTGASDIASFLSENGLETALLAGPAGIEESLTGVEAIVVGLKTRSIDPASAVSQSLDVAEVFRSNGVEQIFFKYCSTFDSTKKGNIGPVTDALLDKFDSEMTVLCPSLPVNGRTVYHGYLFVYDELLNDSHMRRHPVTPMDDSSIVRLMERQSRGKAGVIKIDAVDKGVETVSSELQKLRGKGIRYAVIDAYKDEHLDTVAKAVADFPVLTGGSALGGALARQLVPVEGDSEVSRFEWSEGSTALLSGSISNMTYSQVNRYAMRAPARRIDVDKLMESPVTEINRNYDWFWKNYKTDQEAPLVYAPVHPDEVAALRSRFEPNTVGNAIEEFFAAFASRLHSDGVKRFIVAGGETAGAVTQELEVTDFIVGPTIDPGVPWLQARSEEVNLALKSGNFGSTDFFSNAQRVFEDEKDALRR